MSKYLTRLKDRERYIYTWLGKPLHINRKLRQSDYEGVQVECEGTSKHCININDFVLIKSEDEDQPYVAKLLKLVEDGTQQHPTKTAVVQWFTRIEEIPKSKQKLLGREAHPREIFLYEVSNCDDCISAETLIKAVKVFQIDPEKPFPSIEPGDDSLFVKLKWDGKRFNVLPKNTFSIKKVNNHHKNLDPLPRRLQKMSCENSFPKQCDVVGDSEVYSIDSGDGTLSRNVVNHHSKHCAFMVDEGKSNCSDQKNSNGRKRSTEITNVENSSSKVRRKLPLSDFNKSNLGNILSELLGEDGDKATFAAKIPQLVESAAMKYTQHFNGVSGDALSPSKKLQNGSPGNYTISPIKLNGDNEMNTQVATLKLTPIHIKPKIKQQVSSSQSRKNDKITDLHRAKRKENESKIENVTETPRSRRKSAQNCSTILKQYLNNDQDNEASDEDEYLPGKEQRSESSSENEEQEDDVKFRKKSTKMFVPKTPNTTAKKSVKTPVKTPVSRSPRTICHPTPRIPLRTQLAKTPGNILEEARARLHVSAVPESLPCREQEFQDIYNFVESKVIDGTGGCMYISGVPGTGKTATVHEVMRCLQYAAKEDDLPSFRFIEINGMKLTDPHQSYVQILKSLTGQKATADHAAALLEKQFGAPAPKRETTVLLVDELDLLWTRKQDVMYNLFDWPTRKQAKLVVVAVANTMDLPERIMMNRVASRLGLTRMSFQPYTFKQLQQITCSRLNRLKAFEDDAIQLVARKVAALSGDARRALDICRRAAEICQYSEAQKTTSKLVGMPHVVQALDEMFSSPYVTAIRNASAQEQIFMRAVLAEFQRLGLEEATFQQIYQQHIGLCRIEGLQPPTMSQTMLVCTKLGACRLLLVESSKNDLYMRVRLNVSQDDVMYALKE
ncbi:origin recognition complex subunit 1 isoform X1 [Hemiscyllium ocellatum]|uniref:origin recognition complex subunit 1 isoform X1 n=1 Tax=Hemiscyllium ocellatum TaxID=170820 RepID=UPI002965DE4B|nr:origin recognition complex subunit 1 isoform X1 [Hemiscyllium ocellatum]